MTPSPKVICLTYGFANNTEWPERRSLGQAAPPHLPLTETLFGGHQPQQSSNLTHSIFDGFIYRRKTQYFRGSVPLDVPRLSHLQRNVVVKHLLVQLSLFQPDSLKITWRVFSRKHHFLHCAALFNYCKGAGHRPDKVLTAGLNSLDSYLTFQMKR